MEDSLSRYKLRIWGTICFSFQVMVLSFALLGDPVIAVAHAPQGDFYRNKTVRILIAFGVGAKLLASTSVDENYFSRNYASFENRVG